MCLKVGYDLKEEIERKFDKWQEPPPVKQVKPLPAPLDGQRKKRGGRRCCSPPRARTLNGPKTGEAQGFSFQRCRSVINTSVSVSPKVPKDEGASGADGDQETC